MWTSLAEMIKNDKNEAHLVAKNKEEVSKLSQETGFKFTIAEKIIHHENTQQIKTHTPASENQNFACVLRPLDFLFMAHDLCNFSILT